MVFRKSHHRTCMCSWLQQMQSWTAQGKSCVPGGWAGQKLLVQVTHPRGQKAVATKLKCMSLTKRMQAAGLLVAEICPPQKIISELPSTFCPDFLVKFSAHSLCRKHFSPLHLPDAYFLKQMGSRYQEIEGASNTHSQLSISSRKP